MKCARPPPPPPPVSVSDSSLRSGRKASRNSTQNDGAISKPTNRSHSIAPARCARIGWHHPMKPATPLETLILTLRQQKVILDADLAALFGVPTKRLNEQVSRNAERFPVDFMFQLTAQEWSGLKSQSATSSVEVTEKETDAPTALRSQFATLKSAAHRLLFQRPPHLKSQFATSSWTTPARSIGT